MALRGGCIEYELLPIPRLGDSGAALFDDGGHVAGAQLRLDDAADTVAQRGPEGLARAHDYEKADGLVPVRLAAAADADGVLDLAAEEARQDVVDLGAAEAHTRRLEHAVAAAQHRQPARALVDAHKVAMVPNALESLKVAAAVFGVAAGAPEGEGLAGEGLEAAASWDVSTLLQTGKRNDQMTRMGKHNGSRKNSRGAQETYTSSPSSPGVGSPVMESATPRAIPSPAHWISPTYTGNRGQGAPKSEMMSVPPVIEARLMCAGKAL